MRDCIFLLADLDMEAAFQGFFSRKNFHYALGTAPFIFDHKHAVIVLDNAWDGSPGVEKIRADISARMEQVGWDRNRFVVIVIDPELEALR